MNRYDTQDLSDEQLEAVTGGGGISVNVNPTVITQVGVATSVSNINQVAVVAASKLVNSTVGLQANALTLANASNSAG